MNKEKQSVDSSTQRIKTKFLWLPKNIKGKTKWLTKATWLEELKADIDYEALDLGSSNTLIYVWKPVKWIKE